MSRGFTLVEMVVAVLILGIAGAVTVPAFGRLLHRDPGTAAADEVVRVLRSARLTALERGVAVELVIDAERTRFWVWLHERPGEPVLLRDSSFAFATGIVLEGAAPRVRFVFHPAGLPVGSALVIRDLDRIHHVTIDPWTGGAVVQPR